MKTVYAALLAASALSLPAHAQWIAAPEVIEGRSAETISGHVFEDADRDGGMGEGEAGIEGVLVSNGLDVTRTGADGAYELAVREDMDLTVVQPAGWRVPVDERQVPQFSYTHKPGGTPERLRFGGLPDTGPAPERVNFPLRRADEGESDGGDFTCAVVGDSQTYSNHEISQFRDSAVADLVASGLTEDDCVLYVGDVVGDDLGLLDRILEVGSAAGAPQWLVHGNHDYDFDATDDAHSSDSWRRLFGPNYYAFEMGEATFIVLDNIVYPCGPQDMEREGREQCGNDERAAYNARVTDTQMDWLENLLAETPEDRLVVIAHHAPFVSFVDAGSPIHQTDNLAEIHALLEGREALSLSGHTHTTENLAPGELFDGWTEQTGTGPLPFRHIVAGAASGNWWQGDFNLDGDAQSLQRMGAPKGVLMLDVDGADYEARYAGSRIDADRGQWVDFNTPAFRDWFEQIDGWRNEDRETRDPIPPVTVNDLPDTRILTPGELAEGVWATANVWLGSRDSEVTASINGGDPFTLERTQAGEGEEPRIGADWADPFAVKRQATVGRFAYESRSGEERNQGWEAFRGSSFQGPPQPQTALADRNVHLWRARLPEDLPTGVHVLELTSTTPGGRDYTDRVIFEVREQRPPARHRSEVWDDGES